MVHKFVAMVLRKKQKTRRRKARRVCRRPRFSGISYAPAICIDQIGANPVVGSGKAVNLRAKPLIVKHYGRTQEPQFIYGEHGTHAP